MPKFEATLEFHWDRRWKQGEAPPGRVHLQQWWREVGEPRQATQEDVNAGNAAFVGSDVSLNGEWRDVPGHPDGFNP